MNKFKNFQVLILSAILGALILLFFRLAFKEENLAGYFVYLFFLFMAGFIIGVIYQNFLGMLFLGKESAVAGLVCVDWFHWCWFFSCQNFSRAQNISQPRLKSSADHSFTTVSPGTLRETNTFAQRA